MFARLSQWLWPKEAEKIVLGVKVKVTQVEGEWYALFRAWDRGHVDHRNELVPEHVALAGRDAGSALNAAKTYISNLQERRGDELIVAKKSLEGWGAFAGDGLASTGPIKTVFIFPNGMCSVLDAAGEQLTSYQGLWDNVSVRLMRDAPIETEFNVAFAPAARELRAASRGWKIEARGID